MSLVRLHSQPGQGEIAAAAARRLHFVPSRREAPGRSLDLLGRAAFLIDVSAPADAVGLHPDLKVAEAVFTWIGYTAGRDLYDQVTELLVQLVEECGEAEQLMRGRTFARAVH